MAASGQVEIPFYWGIGGQAGREFGAFAQVIGRTAIPLLRKCIHAVSKCVDADLLEFVVPELAEDFSGKNYFKMVAKSGGIQPPENFWAVVAWERVQAGPLQWNLKNEPVSREEIFSQTFLTNLVNSFSVWTFCYSFLKSWRESPSSGWYLVVSRTRDSTYYLTRWKVPRVWISNRSELLRWFETDVLGFETEVCQGPWLQNLHYQRS